MHEVNGQRECEDMKALGIKTRGYWGQRGGDEEERRGGGYMGVNGCKWV